VGIQRLLPLNNLDSWVFMFLGVIRGIYPLYSFGPLINTLRGDDKEGRRRPPFLLPLLAKTKKEESYPP